MIKSLSPYYLTIPFVSINTGLTCTEFTLSIYVWDGLKASPPATATYTKTIPNPTGSTSSHDVNIARLISDFIEFAPQKAAITSVIDGNNNQWVKTSVTYITTDPLDATTPQEVSTSLMSLGHSYGNEGRNITAITDDTLLTPQDYKVNRNGVFVVPVLVSESATVNIIVKSFPLSEINLHAIIPLTTDSSELVKYIWVQIDETTTDKYIEVSYNSKTTTLLIQDEYKYIPIDIFFQNKEGAEQVITFFKEQTESMSVTSSSFESNRGQPSDGNHQFVRYNVQGSEKLKLNSGFIDEEMNEIVTQLLLSERIWSYVGGNFTPLDIEKKNIEYKTQQKQRLINYEIDFKPSYNKVNNI